MFCSRCGTWAPDDAAVCTLCGAPLRGDLPPAAPVVGAYAPAPAIPMPAAAPVAVPALHYAGFWRRFAAVLIDSVLLWFPSATVRVLLGMNPLAMLDMESPVVWASACFEYLLGWAYAAFSISSSSLGTLGHQVMGLQVTDLHGGRISFAHATGRYLAQILTLFTFGLGYLIQLFTPRRQTLHDLVSRTVVVRARHDAVAAHTPFPRMAP